MSRQCASREYENSTCCSALHMEYINKSYSVRAPNRSGDYLEYRMMIVWGELTYWTCQYNKRSRVRCVA